MPKARNGAVDLEFQSFGDDRPEAILLVNGLGSQMTRWPEAFCEKLVARGYRAIRFDNRDTGLSTWLSGPYVLADMADDAVAVLDAAGVTQAHVAGVSMGGMIVQRMAIDHPDRVLSMTSIMSATSGDVVATPEAVISLVQTAANELYGTGIRVNAVAPGLIETGMTKPIFDGARARGNEDKIGQLNPTTRYGQPEEIAAAALFLASDDASYVNGQTLAVDGGLSTSHPVVRRKK